MELPEIIDGLFSKDDKQAYKLLQELEKLSDKSDEVYEYFDVFLEMLEAENSYVRVRGFRLICKNSKWDNENKIDKNIDKILLELEDEKPTAVRQCLKAIIDIVLNKKELNQIIKDKLLSINYLNYKDSMQSLIFKDVEEILKIIDKN